MTTYMVVETQKVAEKERPLPRHDQMCFVVTENPSFHSENVLTTFFFYSFFSSTALGTIKPRTQQYPD